MKFTTLIDTCVWIDFFDPREAPNERENVASFYELLKGYQVLMPWPLAFETLRTRFARNRIAMNLFETELSSSRIQWLSDEVYRDDALKMVFESSLRLNRPLSLVDCLLRLVLNDRSLQIEYFATRNDADFRDVCQERSIEIVSWK